jgi:hypothetical protein
MKKPPKPTSANEDIRHKHDLNFVKISKTSENFNNDLFPKIKVVPTPELA